MYLGSIFTDFKPQIETLNREKYTIISWDPPGYGFSRPPDRDFSSGFFDRDADCVITLMKVIIFFHIQFKCFLLFFFFNYGFLIRLVVEN